MKVGEPLEEGGAELELTLALRKTLEETGRSPAFAPANVHGLRARTRRWLRSRASLLPITARAFDRAGRS